MEVPDKSKNMFAEANINLIFYLVTVKTFTPRLIFLLLSSFLKLKGSERPDDKEGDRSAEPSRP